MSTLAVILSLLPFYLLGAFPTGYLVSKLHGVDIFARGSGNIGATNIARVIGKKAGIVTLAIDVVKGALGVWLAGFLVFNSWYPACVGVAVVMGHCFSIPRLLKGGKGVATALGVISVLYPSSALVALIVFGGFFAVWRIVSLAAIAATLVVPGWALVTNANDSVSIALMVIATIIVIRHEQNLRRLIEGREPKFTTKKADAGGSN